MSSLPLLPRKGRFTSLQLALLAGAAVLLAAIGAGAWLTLRLEYRSEVDEILGQAEQTAQKLASRTAEVLDQVNQTTLLVKFVHERGDPISLATLEDAGVLAHNLLRSVLIADARGNVLDATSGQLALNVADEDDFKQLKKGGDVDLLIGRPARHALTGEWSVPVSRRLLGPTGAFNGIVSALVDPATFSATYGRTESPRTVIGVLGRDGIYRARSVGGKVSFGESIDVEVLTRHALEIRERREPYVSPIDAVRRFVVRVDVDRYPFMAVIAVDAGEALAGYMHTRSLVLRWSTALAALVVGALAALLAQAGKLDRSRSATVRAERAFRATIEGCLDGVAILRPERDTAGALVDLTVVDVNVRAAAMLRKSRDEVISRRLCELAPSIRGGNFLLLVEQAFRSGKTVSTEARAREPGMEGRWLHHQFVPLDDGLAMITRDVTEQKEAEAALAALARFDPLTQLANRRHFEESLQAARGRALRSGEPLALVYIDLDGFKKINDRFGHEGGDLLLVEVGQRLLACVRSTDVVSRLGGDEFAIVLEAAGNEEQIRDACERILASLSTVHLIDGHSARATPSIGAVVLTGDEPAEVLRRRADEAMYAAKRAGKAQHCIVFPQARAAVAPAALQPHGAARDASTTPI